MTPPSADKIPGRDLERAVALVLRTLHLMAVVALGAALLGAPLARNVAAGAVLVSGLALLLLDLLARRIALGEVAGAVVLVKLAAMVWVALGSGPHAEALFWLLVVISSLSSHAPKHWRHRALWRRRSTPASAADR
jgi:hypothetical protein